MCTLIYVTVPSAADLTRLPSTAVRLAPSEDPFVAPKLRPREVLCRPFGVPTCGGGGFCGTVIGRQAYRSGRDREERDSAHATKLRKKGWSEHKVQAWLAQKQEVRPSPPANLNGNVDELALWQELLRAAFEEAHLRFVGLMVFTAGDEPELPTRDEDMPRAACDLTRLQSGVLYRIRR